jgi:carbon monoxide dehydrogenase subunit G
VAVVQASIEISASPQEVWDVIMDPARLKDWVTIHRKLGDVSSDPLEVGATVDQTMCLRGANFKVHWRVVEYEPPTHAVWEGRGPARATALIRDDLRAVDGGTRFDYTNEFKAPMGPLGSVASRVLVGGVSEREAHASLQRLKTLLET